MADVRALLKAKRQEVRISHPLATYTSTGQLRCIACGTPVKEGSAWNGHVGSKAHRMNVARMKEEERQREERARLEQEEEERQRKRKAEEDGEEGGEGVKRQRLDEDEDEDEDEEEQDEEGEQGAQPKAGGFPAGFFSDPSRAPPPPTSDDSDDEQDDVSAANAAPAPQAAAPSALDTEWEQFANTVLNAPDTMETYERATVFAEPVLAAEVPEGFPSQGDADTAGEVDGREAMLDEAEKRRWREQEDRELIMDRLLDEERAQEEADAKVVMLKTRLEALRRAREARLANGKSKGKEKATGAK
ncbi:hypothetical protein WOLCODRAFT_152649 [Wolfiporia cocos MD-104 SS10]|uniref:Uncharacterized protein n=1 Tax=Wolfiporia cocos (strain MD-104) TaxID=742152 RepID=A0A2H3JL68_WOLCO|nr:hypothetical protein WOLCODRAFT_152649 [Wolfiporia cocos MD-104 SS10]